MMGPAVLVVEDVPQIRATAVQLFQELGCEVFDAYNGQSALKILEARPEIQVLFADVRMPGMSGPELASPLV
jgi:CheY-like chemotaxis protein